MLVFSLAVAGVTALAVYLAINNPTAALTTGSTARTDCSGPVAERPCTDRRPRVDPGRSVATRPAPECDAVEAFDTEPLSARSQYAPAGLRALPAGGTHRIELDDRSIGL